VGLAVAGAVAVAIAAARLPGAGIAPASVEHGDTGSMLFLAAAAAAFALYVVAVAILGRRYAALSTICAIAAAIQLLPLAGPLLQSRDVYAYWDYGRLAAEHDANPYVTAPDRYPSDPAYAAMAKAWRTTPSVYGPGFTVASAGIAEAAGSSPADAAWTYRLAAAAGMLVLVGLAAVRARRGALAAAVVGWNPLLALQSAGGGHNDVWMMAFVLAALVLADRGRTVLAGVSWAAASSSSGSSSACSRSPFSQRDDSARSGSRLRLEQPRSRRVRLRCSERAGSPRCPPRGAGDLRTASRRAWQSSACRGRLHW
jgi:putative intracellular protease/amidase